MNRWLPAIARLLGIIGLLAGALGLYLKSKVIDESHNPACCKDGVPFSDLGPTRIISRNLAAAYHIDTAIFLGVGLLFAVIILLERKYR
jgi:hypothetical protein